MNKLGLLISIITTVLILWVVDFFTLFLVIGLVGYYRYLKVQNTAQKLSGFSQTIYQYMELVGKYVLLVIDGLINIFF